MSIHLVGGGWSHETAPEVFGPFVAEATERALASGRIAPRIGILVVRESGDPGHAADIQAALGAGGPYEPVVTSLAAGEVAAVSAVSDVDGIVIGGGLTPDYLTAVATVAGEIRRQVSSGTPYLGYSAGAMVAADRALLGGWRIGGVEVSPQRGSEYLEEIEFGAGIGLLDVSVDVHAAQWGTLSRFVAAVEAGLIEGGLAIDEGTALIVGEGALTVVGTGSVWRVSQAEGGVLVGTFGA